MDPAAAAMPSPPEHFATARLIARRPRLEDAAAIFAAYAGDPEATRHLSFRTHRDVAGVATFLRDSALPAWRDARGHRPWMLCLRGTDVPIGSIGLSLDDGKAMFGYVLGRPHWGRGLMTEALRWLVDWSLAQPEIFRAWAFCDAENPASARVMEKAGMTREGVWRRWHRAPNLGAELRDCIVCAKVR